MSATPTHMQTVTFRDLRHTASLPPELLLRTEADLSAYLGAVRDIIDEVRRNGDAALVRYAREFDHVVPAAFDLRVTEAEFAAAEAAIETEVRNAIGYAADNIRRFHAAQKPLPITWMEVQPGAFAGERCLPIDSVACYVPRGKGAFPSVVMMTAIPAVVAQVPHICIITPPGPDGRVDAGTLVAARIAGVERIYKCGGAQGVAAVAFGTHTVPRCEKVIGPGSPWVVAAKRLLREVIDPGVPAGPSECIILADDSCQPHTAALDLIIESEHGPDSSAYLVTSCESVARAVAGHLPRLWADMEPQRAEFSRAVLCGPRGGVLLVRDLDAAIDFINDYAPEHLELMTRGPMGLLERIRHAGEVLLGAHTPVTLGNFVLGPNAVLPTNRSARTASPLSVHDFMKRSSVGYVTPEGFADLARHALVLARYEGFDGHARALSQRGQVPPLNV
jgi:histidinol dehydrogenase